MKEILKCGIVGYGYMGEIRRGVIERHPKLELTGICEVNEAVQKRIDGCRAFDSIEKLLKEDIDIVFVCTPNCYSPEICVKSMKAGKHVFCEKPPGCNLNDVKNIISHENERVKLM